MSKHHPDDILDKVHKARDLYEMTETSDFDDAFLALHEAVKMIAENMTSSESRKDRWLLKDGTDVKQRLYDILNIPTGMQKAAILAVINGMEAES